MITFKPLSKNPGALHNVPPVLNNFLRRCLQKNPKKRIRDIGDVTLAMEGAFETAASEPSEPAVAPTLRLWQRPVAVLGIAVIVALVTGLAVWTVTRPTVNPAGLMRFSIVPPETAALNFFGAQRDLAISPDGTQVIYKGPNPDGSGPQLNLRPFDQLVGAPLRGGEGGLGPFVSPNGQWVGFTPIKDPAVLQKVSILGGPPVKVTESPNRIYGASWGADDQIIFGTFGGGLFRVSEGGGEPEALTTLDAGRGRPAADRAARCARCRHGRGDAAWPRRCQPALCLDGASGLRRQ